MKKIFALMLCFCLVLGTLCSCSTVETTTETTETTETTMKWPTHSYDPYVPNLLASSLEEALSELKTSEADIADVVNENGTLYFPETKDEIYEFSMLVGSGHDIVYYFIAKQEYLDQGTYFCVDIHYKKRTMDDVKAKLEASKNTYEVLDNGCIYNREFGHLYFTYGEYVHRLELDYQRYPTPNLNWQDYISIKAIAIEE